MADSDQPTYLGFTTFRRTHKRFGIKQPDRLMHTMAIGATGVGKSTLIYQMAMQDALAGRGCAVSRMDAPEEARRPFHLYVDEFPTFSTLAFANMLTELRKSAVGIVLAAQHCFQMEPEVRHAVLGNVGTLVCFRVGVEDAALFAKELAPKFEPLDVMNLPNRRFYTRLMIDGVPSVPFSAELLPRLADSGASNELTRSISHRHNVDGLVAGR